MAFGGYKFKGYKVVRANLANNTYANWCLLVHQARIKAFMESCSLSGAQWHFSKTNGDLSFESYGNVIYRVANGNGEYHDYLSFFKYGDEELYYMLATLGEYYYNSTQGTPYLYSGAKYCVQGGGTTSSLFKYAGYASALSLSEFNDLGPFRTYPNNALPCTSQRSGKAFNFYTNGVKEGTANCILSVSSSIKIGYATKGKDIITIMPNGKTCIESGDGFSSLCDPQDSYTIVKINLGSGEESSSVTAANTYALDFWSNECLTSVGLRLNSSTLSSSNDNSCLALVPSALPYIQSGGQYIPYGSAYLSTLNMNVGNDLNSNFILVKGVIKNELLSVNCFDSSTKSQQPLIGTTVMNGNLLTCCCVQHTPSSGGSGSGVTPSADRCDGGYAIPGTSGVGSTTFDIMYMYPVAYCGWDASNPDINNDDSWPELVLS